MIDVVEVIRVAVSPEATQEARAAGVQACRAILQALEPNSAPVPAATAINTAQLANIVGALRGVSPDQLLELAIAKLRSALPTGTELPKVEPLKFHIIQLPQARG